MVFLVRDFNDQNVFIECALNGEVLHSIQLESISVLHAHQGKAQIAFIYGGVIDLNRNDAITT